MKKRDYKKEYLQYHAKPKEILRRSLRNKARNIMRKIHGIKIINKDIDHIDRNPTNNKFSNLRIQSIKTNRSNNSRK
jgi:DNA primase